MKVDRSTDTSARERKMKAERPIALLAASYRHICSADEKDTGHSGNTSSSRPGRGTISIKAARDWSGAARCCDAMYSMTLAVIVIIAIMMTATAEQRKDRDAE